MGATDKIMPLMAKKFFAAETVRRLSNELIRLKHEKLDNTPNDFYNFGSFLPSDADFFADKCLSMSDAGMAAFIFTFLLESPQDELTKFAEALNVIYLQKALNINSDGLSKTKLTDMNPCLSILPEFVITFYQDVFLFEELWADAEISGTGWRLLTKIKNKTIKKEDLSGATWHKLNSAARGIFEEYIEGNLENIENLAEALGLYSLIYSNFIKKKPVFDLDTHEKILEHSFGRVSDNFLHELKTVFGESRIDTVLGKTQNLLKNQFRRVKMMRDYPDLMQETELEIYNKLFESLSGLAIELGMLRGYYYNQSVYHINQTLGNELLKSECSATIEIGMLREKSFTSMAVDISELDNRYKYTDSTGEEHEDETYKKAALAVFTPCFAHDANNNTYANFINLALIQPTDGTPFVSMQCMYELPYKFDKKNIKNHNDILKAKMLNLLLYYFSDNADIKPRYQNKPATKPAHKNKNALIKSLNNELHFNDYPRIFDVGENVGKKIEEAYKSRASRTRDENESSAKRPHMRAGHYHQYWQGKRDSDKQKLITHYLEPMFINMKPEDL